MLPSILRPLQASLHELDEELRERRRTEVQARGESVVDFDDEDELYVPAVDQRLLSKKLAHTWTDLTAQNPPAPADDRLKQILDVTIREAVLGAAQQVSVSPDQDCTEGWLAQARLRDVLDINLCLLEAISTTLEPLDANGAGPSQPPRPALDPGQMLIPILEDLLDVLTVNAWIRFFGWMETRAERLTRGMEPSRGKALPLLKLLNALLRITPRTAYPDGTCLEFRARVQLFLAREIPLFDQSGVNPRGEYATDLGDSVIDDELEQTENEVTNGNGMEVDQQEEEGAAHEPSEADTRKELRRSLRSVHQVCANPALIASPSGLETFKRDTESVIAAITKAKGASTVATAARYYVGPNIDADLQDSGYRRQLSIQLLIVLRSLQDLMPATRPKAPSNLVFPAAFKISTEDAQWAADRAAEVLANDSALAGFVTQALQREHTYELWKHLKCFNWSQPSVSQEALQAADENRKRLTAPLRPYVFSAGTRALSALARNPLTSVEQLKNFQLDESIESLKEKYDAEAMDEEDDKAMGKETPQSSAMHVENKASLSWRAMRIAVHEDVGILPDVIKGDLPTLVQAREKRKQRQESTMEEEASATPMGNDEEDAEPADLDGAQEAEKGHEDQAPQGEEVAETQDAKEPNPQSGATEATEKVESGTPAVASADQSPQLDALAIDAIESKSLDLPADLDMQAADAVENGDARELDKPDQEGVETSAGSDATNAETEAVNGELTDERSGRAAEGATPAEETLPDGGVLPAEPDQQAAESRSQEREESEQAHGGHPTEDREDVDMAPA